MKRLCSPQKLVIERHIRYFNHPHPPLLSIYGKQFQKVFDSIIFIIIRLLYVDILYISPNSYYPGLTNRPFLSALYDHVHYWRFVHDSVVLNSKECFNHLTYINIKIFKESVFSDFLSKSIINIHKM